MEYIIGVVLVVASFVAGFFVGKKHGYRLAEIEAQIKAAVEKK